MNRRGHDSFVANAGVSWDFTDRLTVFVQGDFLETKRENYSHPEPFANTNVSHHGLAGYVGAIYRLGGGATLEAGYRREMLRERYNGGPHLPYQTRTSWYYITSNTLYAILGFAF